MKQALIPSRAIFLLIGIGLIDLISTAVLHAQGRIVELNPLMKPLIEHSEWSFVAVKGMTLVAAAAGLIWYGRQNREFVRKACIWGSLAYVTVFAFWFVTGQ
jgi:hypothetical protein